jgi:hypothetical protein
MALVQAVLRESYVEATTDLRDYAEQVRFHNKQKKALREYLAALQAFRVSVLSTARERSVEVRRGNNGDRSAVAEVFESHAHTYDVGEIEYQLHIPDRVPSATVNDFALLDNEIARWDERLGAIGDDVQLASVELQNMLQKQQQILQMMSNISRMMHDTTMAVIRKMGG